MAGAFPLPNPVPNPEAFRGWNNIPESTAGAAAPETFARIPVACADKELVPTNPQQTTKTYHVFKSGRYDHSKLTADDEACAFGAKNVSSKGIRLCFSPDSTEYGVISDFYQDHCGHSYRGFWEVQFMKKDENMGNLFSRGRTMYQDPHSPFKNDMYTGNTYALVESDFLFLAPVTADEIKRVQKERDAALRTSHRLNSTTLIFEMKVNP